MGDTKAWIIAVSIGISIGIGTFVWLVAAPVFCGLLALFWTLGIRLLLYRNTMLARSESHQMSLWSGAFAGLLTLAAWGGFTMLPISNGLGFALGLFVTAIGITMFSIGIEVAFAYKDGELKNLEEGGASTNEAS